MASTAPPAPNVELLFGPMLIGVLLNTMGYGVILVQMLMYYDRYKPDPKGFRYLVLYLLIVETVNVVFDVGLIYEPLIVRYGNTMCTFSPPFLNLLSSDVATTKSLQISPLLLKPDAAVTVAISTPTQLFVAWRLKTLTESYLFSIPITILSLISFAGGISVTVNVSLHPEYAAFSNFEPFVITWLASTAACDVLLSAALIYSLYTRKNKDTSSRRLKNYIDRIIRLTLQTGSITAVAALLDLLVFLFTPVSAPSDVHRSNEHGFKNTTLNFIWDFPLSKLYTIALLSSLNARPRRDQEAREQSVNALFEETPSIPIHTSRSETPLELYPRRYGDLSTFVANRDTEDLESGRDIAMASPF
ncbi:hypothetical protein C8R43DRAFT_1244922 [Mycena crocata]|nr:hypothetical protein C8R43DRAFT_1244922 [Mycena crocata]